MAGISCIIDGPCLLTDTTWIASSAVAIPLISHFVAREQADTLFGYRKDGLIRNNQTILAVTLLLLGIVMLSRGIEFSGLLTSSDSR